MKYVIDLDGTLIDSTKRHYLLMDELLQGISNQFDAKYFMDYKADGHSGRHYLTDVLKLSGDVASDIMRKWQDNIEKDEWLELDTLYPDAIPFLKSLQENMHEICFLSARQNKDGLFRELEHLGLCDWTSEIYVVNPENASEEKKRIVSSMEGLIYIVGDTENEWKLSHELSLPYLILNRGFRSKKYWDAHGIISWDTLLLREQRISIPKEYPYFYETHLHTSEASACSSSTGEEMALAAKKFGYTGIFVSNHNWYGNSCVDKELEWKEWIHQYCAGYRNAKKCGDEIGLDVFFAYEASYNGTDFLIYGVDEQWLMEHPEIKDATVKQQYRLIHEAGGMVIHAHPYREAFYIPKIRLFPEYVDGVEGINATHSSPRNPVLLHKDYDHKALDYAGEYQLPITAGSDVHNTRMLGGGMAFREKLCSEQDYIHSILSGRDYLLSNGESFFTKEGIRLGGNW